MRYYFIINPNSGKVNKAKLEKNIGESCLKREIPYDILYTQKQGDGSRIAAQIPDDEECVVFSVGGDGNLNEVLNGIVGSKNKMLGNIPAGSGNDFARSLKKLDSGILTMDLGKINDCYFVNIACVGLDADVANNIEIIRQKRWIPVSQRYHASIIYTFIKYVYKKLKIKMGDTEVQSDCTILAICNGQYYGGGFHIAPHALMDDGMFDIYLVKKMPKIKILPLIIKLMKGRHESSPMVERYVDGKIIVDCEEDYAFNVDGETVINNHFEISIEKSAIRVFNDKRLVKDILK